MNIYTLYCIEGLTVKYPFSEGKYLWTNTPGHLKQTPHTEGQQTKQTYYHML